MARKFGLEIKIPDRTIKLWQQRFAVEAPNAFARANKYALDEVAKQAVNSFRRDAHKVIDQPRAWTLRGIRYRRSDYSANWSEQSSSIFMMDDQSAVLKYLMGERRRLPGDVGPMGQFIAVPRKNNLAAVGVRLQQGGNLPSATLTRLRREAGVTVLTTQPRPPKGRQRAQRRSAR